MAATCVECNVSKAQTDFEKTPTGFRRACKACRQKKRAKASKDAVESGINAPRGEPKPCAKCLKTTDDGAVFMWRYDTVSGGWRSLCNNCCYDKGHTQAYRAKRLAEDPIEYRAHNAKVHLDWANRNRDKVREQQIKMASQPSRRIRAIRSDALLKGKTFEDADMDALEAKLTQQCQYCGSVPIDGETLNGLDRIDCSLGYNDTNTVACCVYCNAMKCVMNVDEFIQSVRDIAHHIQHLPGTSNLTSRPPLFGNRHTLVKKDKGNPEDMPEEVLLQLWSSPCYLCGRTPSVGIDRKDASKGYSIDNCHPCCTTCNYMKKDIPFEDFLHLVRCIDGKTSQWVLQDVSVIPIKTCTGLIRDPVVVRDLDTNAMMMFPSTSSATRLCKLSALGKDSVMHQGMSWNLVSAYQYRTFNGNADESKYILMNLRNRI